MVSVCSLPVGLQAVRDLDWEPEFSLVNGLRDSYTKDFARGTVRKPANFTTDDVSRLLNPLAALHDRMSEGYMSPVQS